MKDRLHSLLMAAIDAANPTRVLPAFLRAIPDPRPNGRLIVVGAGKASAAMADAVRAHFGPCEGLMITRYGHQGSGVQDMPEVVQASHPLPDAAGAAATARMMGLLAGLSPHDIVLALISGGASALLTQPRAGVTLADKAQLSADLLGKGAPIGDINLIRKQFSDVKAGRLAALAAPARVIGLIISDVAGDDLADIGSGPTVADPRDAAAAAQRWGIDLPPARAPLAPLTHVQNHLVAAPMASLRAAAAVAQSWGWRAHILGDDLDGEARDLAREHAKLALDIAAPMRPSDPARLILSGGEVTVTLGAAKGGIGGPNAEYALALSTYLNGHSQIYALAADTDGIDGAGDAAGAYIAPATLDNRAAQAAQDLAAHNAHGFFAAQGGAIITGPTQTNVNDFRAILILPPAP
jgi:hydroxypyruvate reductase